MKRIRLDQQLRERGAPLVIILALLVALLWSYGHFRGAREAAALAAGDSEICRQMASRIEQLKTRARAAGSGSMDQTDLHLRGQEALAQIGMDARHLVQVTPQEPRRVGQTAYKEVPRQFVLQDVTLRQLVGFLLFMTEDRPSLQVRSLRLHGPRDGMPGGAQWSAEVTLCYLIYEPPTAINVARGGDR